MTTKMDASTVIKSKESLKTGELSMKIESEKQTDSISKSSMIKSSGVSEEETSSMEESFGTLLSLARQEASRTLVSEEKSSKLSTRSEVEDITKQDKDTKETIVKTFTTKVLKSEDTLEVDEIDEDFTDIKTPFVSDDPQGVVDTSDGPIYKRTIDEEPKAVKKFLQ